MPTSKGISIAAVSPNEWNIACGVALATSAPSG